MQFLRVGPAARTALAFLLALGVLLVPASSASAAPSRGATDRLLDPAAGWHGRAIQRPHDHETVRTAASWPPPGWSAGTVALGTGTRRAGGSERVREVQRRLRRLGYATGPIDGIYGARTRAAVAWFQRKHGLPLDGRGTSATVAHLRDRTGARPAQQPATPEPDQARGDAAPAPASSTDAQPAPRTAEIPSEPAPAGADLTVLVMLLGAGLALLVAGMVLARRERRRPADQVLAMPAGPAPMRPARAAEPPVPVRVPRRASRAIGYVRLAPGAPSASFHAQAAAIEAGCLTRGMTLVSLVSDRGPDPRTDEAPSALEFALARLHEGDVDRLVVSRLDHVAPTSEELSAVLERTAGCQAGLVALDRDLDTAALEDPTDGEALLRRPPSPPPAGPALPTQQTVATHIASMLDEGLTPGDIVDALNAEPVPPPGGGHWDAGGVDATVRRFHPRPGKEARRA